MKQIYANNCATILLGRQGENLARQVSFDVQDLADLYGHGTVELIYQRPGDEQPYPISVERDGNTILWTVNSADTAMANKYGRCELRYYVGETLAKSKIWRTLVESALETPSEEAPPEPQKGWVDRVLSASVNATQAAEKAEDAITKAPKIGENGNWYIWDATQGTYVDTGRYSGGSAPYIGANGNWFIGTEDSGVSATGPAGADGKPGRDGVDGKDGLPGEKGDPFRYEDFTQEQLEALRGPAGKDGKDGQPGQDGYTPQKGIDYFDGEPGKDGDPGKDGYTPVKGVDYFDGDEGKSAYQIAVENGFTGTEAEWLESLHGKDGYDDTEIRNIIDTKDDVWKKVVFTTDDYDSENKRFMLDVGEGNEISEVLVYGQICGNDETETAHTFGIGFGDKNNNVYGAFATGTIASGRSSVVFAAFGWSLRLGKSQYGVETYTQFGTGMYSTGTYKNFSIDARANMPMTIQNAAYWNWNNPRYFSIFGLWKNIVSTKLVVMYKLRKEVIA